MHTNYRVDFEGGDNAHVVQEFMDARDSAESFARAASKRHSVAYVIASRYNEDIGQRVYVDGKKDRDEDDYDAPVIEAHASVELYRGLEHYSVGWSGDDGCRYHFWVNGMKPVSTLYKNPPHGTPFRGEGYFETRHLDPAAPKNAALIREAMRQVKAGDLANKALAAKEAATAAKEAARLRADAEAIRTAIQAFGDLQGQPTERSGTILETSKLDDAQLIQLANMINAERGKAGQNKTTT